MADFEINPRPYFQILHAMFRPDEDLEDYTATVYEWFGYNVLTIEKVTSKAEWRLLCVANEYYITHKVAISREKIDDLVTNQQQPKVLFELLEQYDLHADALTHIHPDDLHADLDHRKQDWEKYRVLRLLAIGHEITLSGFEPRGREKTTLIGPKDAIKYLIARFQKGVLLDDQAQQGGTLASMVDEIGAEYEETKRQQMDGTLFIPTGLTEIDSRIGGLRRKNLIGILGYAGNRKTSMSRTIGFHAALAGFRVLHIPLETDIEEERTAYAVMYAQHKLGYQTNGITKSAVERGTLSNQDEVYFSEVVLPNLAHEIGPNISFRTPRHGYTWAEVKSLIEMENLQQPLDLVIIDYLTLLSTPGAKEERADKTAIAQEVKRFALTANEGRGLCILTPVQGSRKGYEDAVENEGAWQLSGINMYSELDKSLDICFYVFKNDQFSQQNFLKIGSCKMRRGVDLPTTIVTVDKASGMLRNSEATNMMETATKGKRPSATQKDVASYELVPGFGSLDIPE
jgi:hypothetical protein